MILRLIVGSSRERRGRSASLSEIDSLVRVRIGRVDDVGIGSDSVVRRWRRVMRRRLRVVGDVRRRTGRRESVMGRKRVELSLRMRWRRSVRVSLRVEAVVSVCSWRRKLRLMVRERTCSRSG